jgi:hypothetical protein
VARTTLDNDLDNGMDIADAAARLGLSSDTIRKRLQRGKLKGYKTAEGAWRVVLPSPDSPGQHTGQSPDNGLDGSSALVVALRDEVTFLRSLLQARDDEIRRAHILLQQTQQQSTALLSKPQLPWWRRWFGRRRSSF